MASFPLLLAAACALHSALSARVTDGNGMEDTEDEFNSTFFSSFCDLSEFDESPFESSTYKLSLDEEHDNTKWQRGRKCEDTAFGLESTVQTDYQGSQYECAQFCSEKSQAQPGLVVCCAYEPDTHICASYGSWQAMEKSSRGTSKWNPLVWFGVRRAKEARLFYTASPDGTVPDGRDEAAQLTRAKEGQQFMTDLIEQVDTMSVDGIMSHLLSFYVCMRWVPDAEFVKLAKFELTEVSLDHKTPSAMGEVDRNKILDMYLKAHITPLRCSNNYNVQSNSNIDMLLGNLKDESSTLNEVFSFARGVDEDVGWFWKRQTINKGMMFNKDDPTSDAVQVKDMRMKARHQDVLPWSTFLRSSNEYKHERPQPDARYMICFGPRVASLPHKRERGGHVLADANLAGCNGFWNQQLMIDHLERLKFLFAPEMCFEDHLRKQLKKQFLNTFVRMNEEFEQAMMGKFSKRLHDLDPAKSKKLDLLKPHSIDYEETLSEAELLVFNKFKATGGLLANAHSKWLICETKDNVPSAPFGKEDNFFRDPMSYKKWLPDVKEDNLPQCQTLDETTGCVKCIVSVKNEYGCVIRMNSSQTELFEAIQERKWPFIFSDMYVRRQMVSETGEVEFQTFKETGACLVRKSQHTHTIAHEEGGLEGLRRAFFQVNDTDDVVRVNLATALGEGDAIESTFRFDIHKRRAQLGQWLEAGGGPQGPNEDVNQTMSTDIYKDKKALFAQKFIFTDVIAEAPTSNRREHQVDYFVSCPCSSEEFTTHSYFEEVGNKGMAEYING